MKKMFNLQLFAEAVQGKRVIYKYRLLDDAAKEDAFALAFVTENSTNISADSDSTQTKDGTIRTANAPEIEIQSTSILAKGDAKVDKIKDGCLNNKLFEIWEINLDRPATTSNKYHGTYYQGYCSEHDASSDADDLAQLELTFSVNGKGADGECTVTDAELEAASYAFRDTTKVTGA